MCKNHLFGPWEKKKKKSKHHDTRLVCIQFYEIMIYQLIVREELCVESDGFLCVTRHSGISFRSGIAPQDCAAGISFLILENETAFPIQFSQSRTSINTCFFPSGFSLWRKHDL